VRVRRVPTLSQLRRLRRVRKRHAGTESLAKLLREQYIELDEKAKVLFPSDDVSLFLVHNLYLDVDVRHLEGVETLCRYDMCSGVQLLKFGTLSTEDGDFNYYQNVFRRILLDDDDLSLAQSCAEEKRVVEEVISHDLVDLTDVRVAREHAQSEVES
jgi:hypothetical protein